jgi:pyridine nucleotide-disulfide oxidoreductase family protein
MKRLVLLGAGHAHLHVLQAIARERLPAATVVLISAAPRMLYSAMLPGWVAGHYTIDQCSIPIAPLASAAGVEFVEGTVTGLDAADRSITLADGRVAEYDALSLDTGAVMDRDAIDGAREHALAVRPMEGFVQWFGGVVTIATNRVLDVVVIGGGAAGFELALAVQHRLAHGGDERARVSLVTGGPKPLEGHAPGVMARAAAALRARRITVFEDRCTRIEAGRVHLASGARLACDVPLLATGVAAPAWLRASGLQLDEEGFVATGPTLQSLSHPEVLAAGDIASRPDAPHAKSGVHAVRAAPALALNLRRHVAGGTLEPYQPPQRALYLLSCGDKRAIASWGRWSAGGRWAWWWKDRIDRNFVARHAAVPASTAQPGDGLKPAPLHDEPKA